MSIYDGQTYMIFEDYRYLTYSQVAAIVGRSKRTIRRWINKGRFPNPIKINRRVYRFLADDVKKYLCEVADREGSKLWDDGL